MTVTDLVVTVVWGVMVYTLGDAARASGKSKTTIAKAIKSGRISALRGEDGSYQIDPAELHRVYPMTVAKTGNNGQYETPTDIPVDGGELAMWRALATEREETIRDLRRRLDQATALLVDRRTAASSPTGAWGRFLAWRRKR